MRLLKPSLVDKMEQYVPLKLSLTLTIVVFFENLLLHALVMYLYHRFAIFRRLTPKFMKSGDGRIELKPVLSVSAANRKEFVEQGSKIREKYMVLTQYEINGHQVPKTYSRKPQPACLWDYQAEDRTPLLKLTKTERRE